MKKIALIGSTELAQRLIGYITETQFGQVVGMFDDTEEKGMIKHGQPVLGKIEEYMSFFNNGYFDEVMIAIGYNNFDFRKKVFLDVKQHHIPVSTFIHPTAYIHPSARIGEGSIVLINCVVEMNSSVKENVFLSSTCYISHDVSIGPDSYCSPALNIAGHTTIGECCFLGMNTTAIDGIKIDGYVRTAAGTVITKDTPSHVLLAGVPASIKRKLL